MAMQPCEAIAALRKLIVELKALERESATPPGSFGSAVASVTVIRAEGVDAITARADAVFSDVDSSLPMMFRK